MLSPGNQWTDGMERTFMEEELVLIPEDTELPVDLVKNGDASNMSFPTAEQFEQNKECECLRKF